MTTDDIIIRVARAFLRPYPVFVGEAVLTPPRARFDRQVRLYLTPSTYRTLTLEAQVTASRWHPSETLQGFTYSGDVIDPAEVPAGALLTTLSYEEAVHYSEHAAKAQEAVKKVGVGGALASESDT